MTTAAPHTSAMFGASPDVAGQLPTTTGDNPDRLHNKAALAHLCGAAPIPASPGTTRRHRLNRSGDPAANRALHTITLSHLRYDPRTRAYATRRTTEGLSKRKIIRCLKRYIIREIYTAPSPTTPHSPPLDIHREHRDGSGNVDALIAREDKISVRSTCDKHRRIPGFHGHQRL